MQPDTHDLDQASDHLDALGYMTELGQDKLPRSQQVPLLAEHVGRIRAVRAQAEAIATATGAIAATAVIEVPDRRGFTTTYRATWTREGS